MHLAATEGFSEVCVMLYEHDPELLHFRDAWNCTPIMRSIDQAPCVCVVWVCVWGGGRGCGGVCGVADAHHALREPTNQSRMLD